MEENKEETAYHEAGHAVMGCVLERHPLSVSIVGDGKGAVGQTEFEQDAPLGSFRHFDQSETKKKYIRTRVLIEVAGTIAHDIKFPERAHDEGDAYDDHWAKQLVTEGVHVEDDRDGYLASARQEAEGCSRRTGRWSKRLPRRCWNAANSVVPSCWKS
jgi:ATP-dependent Zn protease